MRTLLLALVLLGSAFALAPTASAKPYCTYGEPGCDGLVCTYDPEVCVGEPCWFTCAESAAPSCVHLAHGYGWDSYLCYDVKGAPFCAVWTETRWWEGGYSKNCIPNLPTDVPPGMDDILQASASGPECYDVYNEYDVGPVTVVQRSSCEYEVYWNGEPILQ